MNEKIKEYYRLILLGKEIPIVDKDGKIIRKFIQPERLNPEASKEDAKV